MTLIGSGLSHFEILKFDIFYLRLKKLKDLFSNQTCDDKNVKPLTKYRFVEKLGFCDFSKCSNQIMTCSSDNGTLFQNDFSFFVLKILRTTQRKSFVKLASVDLILNHL